MPLESASLPDTQVAACRDLLAALPDTLGGQARRTVDPSDALGAAWGDPAITLRCGSGVPEGFDRFADCIEAGDVGWYVPQAQLDDPDAVATLTAVGFRPQAIVRVPPDYRGGDVAAVLSQLEKPVSTTLKLVQPCR